MGTHPSTLLISSRHPAAAFIGAMVMLAMAAGLVSAANPATGVTTTDQELSVELSLDATNDPVWLGTPVTADASATLGEGDTANVIYTVDVSGSMENEAFNPFQPAVGDCDGDGLVGTALDAACVGLIALNDSLGSASNLDSMLLLGPRETLLARARKLLDAAGHEPGYIFNVGHGIQPPTPPENVKALVDAVHAFRP